MTGWKPVRFTDLVRLPGRKLEAAVDISIRHGAYLPHWTCPGGIYAVTFRLADSLPAAVMDSWRRERDEVFQRAARQHRRLTHAEIDALKELDRQIDANLDRGQGECLLKADAAASVVRDALTHFDGDRYNLVAWCVMPNHVHAVVHPRVGNGLKGILHSWKSYSANQINRMNQRSRIVWQPESYDHLIRDVEEFGHSVNYAIRNPETAGLRNWRWVGYGRNYEAVMNAVRSDGAPTRTGA